MFIDLKQIVPSEICLACQGCCRFHEEKSAWRPKMIEEEIRLSFRKGVSTKMFTKDIVQDDQCIRAIFSDTAKQFICFFFTPETNSCKIYPGRPFECRLYPFLLTKKDGKNFLAVHLSCPFVQKHRSTVEFASHVAYLKEIFTERSVVQFLEKNPIVVGDYRLYQDELEFLFEAA